MDFARKGQVIMRHKGAICNSSQGQVSGYKFDDFGKITLTFDIKYDASILKKIRLEYVEVESSGIIVL